MFNSIQQSISGPFGGIALAIGLSILGVTADTLLNRPALGFCCTREHRTCTSGQT